jgi:hypothetical protein
MYLMIRTFEERWNVEYLSGVTNEVVELVTVASIHLRKRAEIPEPPGGRASWPVTGAGTIASTGTLGWLTVLRLSMGFERDSRAVVVGPIGFTIEYFVSNGAASFCLFITPSPTRQHTGLFLRYPAAAFVIRLTQSRRLPADTL